MNRTALGILHTMRESLSIIAPIRDLQSSVENRLETLLDWICDLCDDVQVIFVDDASQDATLEILDELQTRYPQFQSLRHTRRMGPDDAVESAIQLALGDFVFLQRSYEKIEAESFHQLWNLRSDPQLVVARLATRILRHDVTAANGLLETGAGATGKDNQEERQIHGDSRFHIADECHAWLRGNPGLQMIRRRSFQSMNQAFDSLEGFEITHRSHRQVASSQLHRTPSRAGNSTVGRSKMNGSRDHAIRT
jgi:hypothetical protein